GRVRALEADRGGIRPQGRALAEGRSGAHRRLDPADRLHAGGRQRSRPHRTFAPGARLNQMMKLRVLIVLLLATTLVAGCGSKSKSASTTTTVSNLPPAAHTSDPWASRVADWSLLQFN